MDSIGFVGLLFRDPEAREISYRGDDTESLSVLFEDRSFGCSQSRFESIFLSRSNRILLECRRFDLLFDAPTVPHRSPDLIETVSPGWYLCFHVSEEISPCWTSITTSMAREFFVSPRIWQRFGPFSGITAMMTRSTFWIRCAERREPRLKTRVIENWKRCCSDSISCRYNVVTVETCVGRLLASGGRGVSRLSAAQFLQRQVFGSFECVSRGFSM